MTGRLSGYRPYHALDCPARTSVSTEPCTCGGLDEAIWAAGDYLPPRRRRLARRVLRHLRRRLLSGYMAGWLGGVALAAFYFMHDWALGAAFAVLWLATAIGASIWGRP